MLKMTLSMPSNTIPSDTRMLNSIILFGDQMKSLRMSGKGLLKGRSIWAVIRHLSITLANCSAPRLAMTRSP